MPLVLRGPGVEAGATVETPVSLVDLAPTLLDLLGVAPMAAIEGQSLVAAVTGRGEVPARDVFAEVSFSARTASAGSAQ